MYQQVMEFTKAALACGSKQVIGDCGKPAMNDLELRVKLIFEETNEFIEACGFCVIEGEVTRTLQVRHGAKPNFLLAIDALCDLLYVIFGAFIAWGLDPAPFFNEVHRSKMTKVGPNALIGPDYDPPHLEKVLSLEVQAPPKNALRTSGGKVLAVLRPADPALSGTHQRTDLVDFEGVHCGTVELGDSLVDYESFRSAQ